MTERAPATERYKAILVLAATIAVVGFNALAASGLVNGVRPEDISNRYLTPVTPAGYAFSIWSLIYLGLSAFSIYQIRPSNWHRFGRVRTYYLITCALNIGWIYLWHHDQIAACFVIILLLAVTLFFISRDLREYTGSAEFWLVKAPFSIYFGWVTAATLVNFAIMLVYLGIELAASTWTVIAVSLILIATGVGVLMRVRHTNYFHPLAIAWALTAIAVEQSGRTAIVVACALGVVACMIAGFSFVVNLPTRTAAQPADQ